MKNRIAICSLLVALFAIPFTASATTFNFQEGSSSSGGGGYTADSYFIKEQAPDSGWPLITALEMEIPSDATAMRSLFEFDISAIPAGSSITSVSLVLNNWDGWAAGTNATLDLHEYGFNIDEDSAPTWNDPDGLGADAAGGTLGTLVSSNFQTWADNGTGDETWTSTAAFVSAAQSALDGSAPLRLLLKFNDEATANQGGYQYRANDYAVEADRPELIVEFQPIPEPSSFVLSLLGLAGLGFVNRRRRR